MSDHYYKRLPILIIASVALVLVFSVVLFPAVPSAPPAPPNPARITWTPTTTETVVSPGETKKVSITFAASRNIRRATAELSPGLAALATAVPSTFEKIRKGQLQTLNLIVAPTMNATLGKLTGTVQLRRGEVDNNDPDSDDEDRQDQGKLLAQTFTVTVDVWSQTKDSSTGLQFLAPPFSDATRLVVNTSTPGQSFIDFQLRDSTDGSFVSEFGIRIYSNPDHLGLSQWFDQNIDVDGILAANRTYRAEQLGDGSDALVFVGPTPTQYLDVGTPLDYAFRLSPNSDQIISITQSQVNSFFDLGYSQDAILKLEIQVLGTVKF